MPRPAAHRGGAADPRLAGRAGPTGPAGPVWCTRPWTGPSAPWCAKAPELARAVDEQVEVIAQLRAEADQSYAEAVRTMSVQSADGTLLRGEVLARWREFVGYRRVLPGARAEGQLAAGPGGRGVPRRAAGARNLKVAVESGLESLLRDEADAAAERAESSWQATRPAGSWLRTAPDLARSSPGLRGRPDGRSATGRARCWTWSPTRAWASGPGLGSGSGRQRGRGGVDDRGLRAHRRLVGAEVGVAGGTAVLAQRVLEAVFGDQAIRRLAETAKEDLDARVQALLSTELLRYHRVLDGLAV